jgi:subtilisin-like proprotein convertase family protein
MRLQSVNFWASRLSLLLCLAGGSVGAQEPLVSSWSGPAVIINETTGVAFPFSLISPNHVITDISVTVDISGGYNGDLYAYLSHGAGFAVLLNRVGRNTSDPFGYSTPGLAATLVGRAAADVHRYESLTPTYNASGQLTGTWGADGRNVDPSVALDTTPRTATLDEFRGLDPNGDWTLYFFDDSAGGISTLRSWSVTVNTSSTTWYGGGAHVVALNDAVGSAGNSPGWSLYNIPGSLTINATPSSKFTILLATLDGISAGPAAHFNSAHHYGWRIVTPTSGITGFNPGAFTVNTTEVANSFNGTFVVAAYDDSLYLDYEPPCQSTTLGHQVIAGQMHMYFTNSSGLKNMQGVVATNCTILGAAYNIADEVLASGLTVVTNARTDLPPGTTRLDLVATKVASGDAWVNVMVKNFCDVAKQFDPVITRLEVTSGNLVQARFTGLQAAEHYLQVINGTPGLKWLEVNLNGHVFRLEPLADGQSVAGDLAAAMNEGDANVVVLTGCGSLGSSAEILITDLPGDNLVQLQESAKLELARSVGQVAISWPDTSTVWQLQFSDALHTGWQDVAVSPTAVDGRLTVALGTSQTAQFFRLCRSAAAVEFMPGKVAAARADAAGNSSCKPLKIRNQTYDGILW